MKAEQVLLGLFVRFCNKKEGYSGYIGLPLLSYVRKADLGVSFQSIEA